MNNLLKINEEVKNAIENNQPVVALESTIISHGLPYPQNIECARMLEKTVRDNGAVPATIGILDGKIIIGLTDDEVHKLAKAEDVYKVSRPDVAYVVAMKKNGATTVAGTMYFAKLAGIKFFATGGIGGVHRFAESSFDISADLEELSNTDVVVVSAGAKAILDIPKTLEFLETKGVPVIGYKTDSFPLFYTSTSKYPLNLYVNSIDEISEIVKTKFDILKMRGGILLANPIPKEYEFEVGYINKLIETALKESVEKNIKGKKVTPFLLSRISELSNNKSVEVNLKLVENNAKIAAQLACNYFKR